MPRSTLTLRDHFRQKDLRTQIHKTILHRFPLHYGGTVKLDTLYPTKCNLQEKRKGKRKKIAW